MIEEILSVVKAIDGTGSIQLLLAGLVPALLFTFVWPRRRAWALRWCLAAGACYLMLTLPVVANALAAPLGIPHALSPASGRDIDALVIFDGDNRRGRLRAARAALESSSPDVIWVLGVEPQWFVNEMPAEGIPLERVRFDTTTTTTREQTAWVTRYQSDPSIAVAVVVSRLQAARVAGLVAVSDGSPPAIVSAPVNREPAASGLWRFFPSGSAWRVSRDAVYEHAALLYYARNGWVPR